MCLVSAREHRKGKNTTTKSILFYEWCVLYNLKSPERWSVWKTASNKLRAQGHLLQHPGLRAWWPLRQTYNYEMKSGSLVMESGWKCVTPLPSIQKLLISGSGVERKISFWMEISWLIKAQWTLSCSSLNIKALCMTKTTMVKHLVVQVWTTCCSGPGRPPSPAWCFRLQTTQGSCFYSQ